MRLSPGTPSQSKGGKIYELFERNKEFSKNENANQRRCRVSSSFSFCLPVNSDSGWFLLFATCQSFLGGNKHILPLGMQQLRDYFLYLFVYIYILFIYFYLFIFNFLFIIYLFISTFILFQGTVRESHFKAMNQADLKVLRIFILDSCTSYSTSCEGNISVPSVPSTSRPPSTEIVSKQNVQRSQKRRTHDKVVSRAQQESEEVPK